MNQNQKTGALIFLIAATLIVVALVLSEGWGRPGVSLYLDFLFLYGGGGVFDRYYEVGRLPTRYVLALLVAVAGYGAIRFFSLIPPIFRRRSQVKER